MKEAIQISEDIFEIVETVTMKDIEGNDFQTKVSIGTFSKSGLEEEKENLELQLRDIDYKLNLLKEVSE